MSGRLDRPVFDRQTRHAAEVLTVAGDDGGTEFEGDGGDLEVVPADGTETSSELEVTGISVRQGGLVLFLAQEIYGVY